MTGRAAVEIEFSSLTDVGRDRDTNQDHCGEFAAPDGRLFIVADGMGGHLGGGTASRLAVETIGEVFQDFRGGPERTLCRAFEAANERIHRLSMEDSELSGMGTTAVALWLGHGGAGWVAHVGDSRAYRLRDGRLLPLTADHSVIADLERRGLLTRDEARVHPRRNEVLRSVGVAEGVEVEVRALECELGDRFLLCSDGLSSMVSDPEIEELLGRERLDDVTRALVAMANERGGSDNITVQVVDIARPGAAARDEEPRAAGAESRREGQASRRQRTHRLEVAILVVALLLLAGVASLVANGTVSRWLSTASGPGAGSRYEAGP